MNILIVFYKNKIIETVNYINNIVYELKNRQHKIVYITDTQNINATHIIDLNNISIVSKTYNLFYLIYIIKKYKIQLIHNISYYNNFICDLVSKITNTPIISTYYTSDNTMPSETLSTNNIFHFKNILDAVNHLENIYQSTYVTKKHKEIPIIMYHRFIKSNTEKSNSRIHLHVKRLEKHFMFLKKKGYETLTFNDLLDKGLIYRLKYGKKFIIITVDDGYKDNYHLLFPLLKKYNFKAIIYMVTGVDYNQWDVEKLQEPKISLMNSQQLIEMVNSGLVEIGGHTLTHPDLTKLTKKEQYSEIANNKIQLETILKQPIISFAYPYGLFNQQSKNIVQNLGYNFSVATENAPDALHQDLYQIKRIGICPWDITLFLWFKITRYSWQTEQNYNLIIKILVFGKKILHKLLYITTYYIRILNK